MPPVKSVDPAMGDDYKLAATRGFPAETGP
jgi:hypothetical protein